MNITVYSTKTCGYCVMLKKFLDDKGVNYTNYSVDVNPIAAQYMISLSGQMSVPFSTIEHDDGKMDKILGFDRAKFEAILSC